MAAKKTAKKSTAKKTAPAKRSTCKGKCTCGPHLTPAQWCTKYAALRKKTDL
jgi:hypothetical protein